MSHWQDGDAPGKPKTLWWLGTAMILVAALFAGAYFGPIGGALAALLGFAAGSMFMAALA